MGKKSIVYENNKAILLSQRTYHLMLLLINCQWLVLWYLEMKVTILSRRVGLNMRNRTPWTKLWVFPRSGTRSKTLSWLITYKSRPIITWELTTEKICLQVHTTLTENSSLTRTKVIRKSILDSNLWTKAPDRLSWVHKSNNLISTTRKPSSLPALILSLINWTRLQRMMTLVNTTTHQKQRLWKLIT